MKNTDKHKMLEPSLFKILLALETPEYHPKPHGTESS